VRSRLLKGAVLMGLAAQVLAPAAFAQAKPEVELEGVIAREQVNGDLQSAIVAYHKIAADPSASRSVRAKALLHLAGCYEKLGRQAQGVYQQIVREFGEQPAAAQARTRLAALKRADQASAPVTLTERRIEMIPGGDFGSSDTDGNRVVYRNSVSGEFIYSDRAAKTSRVVFKAKPNDLPIWAPSRDFSMLALHYHAKANRPGLFAVIKIDGTGYRELMREEENGSTVGWPIEILNWSWDSRHLLVLNRDRLLTVSVASGEQREVVRVRPGRSVNWGAFSPDGKFVAYEELPAAGTVSQLPESKEDSFSRIFVLPLNSGAARVLYEEPWGEAQALRLLDWTADGRFVAIGSARTGRHALHLVPVKDGRPAGEPVFVRYGNFYTGSTSSSGALVCWSFNPGGMWAVHVTSLDQNSRPGVWQRLELRGDNGNRLNPLTYWSPDAEQIVYQTLDRNGRGVVRILKLSTGNDHEIYHSPDNRAEILGLRISCVWAAQQLKVFCVEMNDKPEMLSIAIDSGATEQLGIAAAHWIRLAGHDSRVLYGIRTGAEKSATVRWDIETGQQTTLQEDPLTALVGPALVSLDERWLFRHNQQNIEVRPVSGGEWKRLVTVRSPAAGEDGGRVNHFAVTPDGKWLLYHDIDSAGNQSLFRVSMAGGSPERLGDFPMRSTCCGMEISADGRKLIVNSFDPTGGELWTLENFVPRAPKR